jgi:diguanylate cyclase (GGDEF)-like protein/PAS domain S-box-containing protein
VDPGGRTRKGGLPFFGSCRIAPCRTTFHGTIAIFDDLGYPDGNVGCPGISGDRESTRDGSIAFPPHAPSALRLRPSFFPLVLSVRGVPVPPDPESIILLSLVVRNVNAAGRGGLMSQIVESSEGRKEKRTKKAVPSGRARPAAVGFIAGEEDLRMILEGSPIPRFVIDRNHRVVHWNRALEEMSGIPSGEVMGTRNHWRAFYDRKRPCMADLLVEQKYQEVERWYGGRVSPSGLVPEAFEAVDFFPALGKRGKWLRFTAATLRNRGKEVVGAMETLEDITEQRLAETALKGSEQRLKAVMEGSPIPTFVIGLDHRVIYWNRALEEMSGIRAGEIAGTNQHWRAFYRIERPCMADLLVDNILEEIARWYVGKYEKSSLVADAFEAVDFFPDLGKEGKWLRFTAAALRDAEGVLFGAMETLEDITERKRAEEALIESEKRLGAIVEGSPIPTFIIGRDHRVIHWNRALEVLSGIGAKDAVGTRKHWEAFYNRERPCMADLLVDDLLDEIPPWYTGKYRKSGMILDAYEAVDFFPELGEAGRWLRFTAAPLRDSKGTIFGAIETLEDITERKQASEALQESEQRLKSILEGSPIPTFIIGKDHRILYWNRAMEKLTAVKSGDAVGSRKHWEVFYGGERPSMADLLVDELLDEIPPWYVEKYRSSELMENAYETMEYLSGLGEGGKWLRFTSATLRDSRGTLFGAIETVEDITALKLVEVALKEKEKRYQELSITDGLTGLHNLRHFYTQIKSEIERSNRYKHPLSLLLLDIDDFKMFNDTFGHLEGDKVLTRLGQVIRRCLRKIDSGYRYGGEEFTVILPETRGQPATALAERIRREFSQETFVPEPGRKVEKTVSLGVTEYIPGEELSSFLKRADDSMYRAKKAGKNRVHFNHMEASTYLHPAYDEEGGP